MVSIGHEDNDDDDDDDDFDRGHTAETRSGTKIRATRRGTGKSKTQIKLAQFFFGRVNFVSSSPLVKDPLGLAECPQSKRTIVVRLEVVISGEHHWTLKVSEQTSLQQEAQSRLLSAVEEGSPSLRRSGSQPTPDDDTDLSPQIPSLAVKHATAGASIVSLFQSRANEPSSEELMPL